MAIWYMRQGPEPKPSPALAEKLNISTFLQELLWRRNIVEENDVNAYLDARLSGLINPNQWPQIPEAADFIVKSLLEGKKLVFNYPILEKIVSRFKQSVAVEQKRQEAIIDYDIDEYDERLLEGKFVEDWQ